MNVEELPGALPLPRYGEEERPTILLTSFLVGLLKRAGPFFAPKASRQFLVEAGSKREVFLPFFYRWFDERPWAQDRALRLLAASFRHDSASPPRAFHAPYASRRGPYGRGFYRDLADGRRMRHHQDVLRRECAFLGRLRRAFGISRRMLYIVHLGRRNGRSPAEALGVSLEVLKGVLEHAYEAGVVLALENVADRSGDEDPVGARLTEVEDALGTLGSRSTDKTPAVGWTFDISHALLAYRGDHERISQDLRRMLPLLVHLHVNAPRFYPSEEPWADRHEAPTEGFPPLWNLFRLACSSARFREFRNVTYEVNWAIPLLNPLLGGSRLPAVVNGYRLVTKAAEDALARFDPQQSSPYALADERASHTISGTHADPNRAAAARASFGGSPSSSTLHSGI